MQFTCNKCGIVYDDEFQTTICPHGREGIHQGSLVGFTGTLDEVIKEVITPFGHIGDRTFETCRYKGDAVDFKEEPYVPGANYSRQDVEKVIEQFKLAEANTSPPDPPASCPQCVPGDTCAIICSVASKTNPVCNCSAGTDNIGIGTAVSMGYKGYFGISYHKWLKKTKGPHHLSVCEMYAPILQKFKVGQTVIINLPNHENMDFEIMEVEWWPADPNVPGSIDENGMDTWGYRVHPVDPTTGLSKPTTIPFWYYEVSLKAKE